MTTKGEILRTNWSKEKLAIPKKEINEEWEDPRKDTTKEIKEK